MKKNLEKILTVLKIAGEIHGRKKFQKIFYILQQNGAELRESFYYHHFGPYSNDLSLEIEYLAKLGRINESSEMPYIYNLNNMDQFNESSDIYKFKAFIEFLNKKDTNILELVATLYYLEENGYSSSEKMKKKAEILKPHLKDRIEIAFQLKNQLKSLITN